MEDEEEPITAEQYRTGARIFAGVAVVFAVGYVVTPDGPWRWLELAITVVCLARSGWYFTKIKGAPAGKGKDEK